jgi:hypothetical protein
MATMTVASTERQFFYIIGKVDSACTSSAANVPKGRMLTQERRRPDGFLEHMQINWFLAVYMTHGWSTYPLKCNLMT